MATCPNCKKALSCGCQKRTASDGKQVCSNCIKTYQPDATSTVTKKTVVTNPMTGQLTKDELVKAQEAWSVFLNKTK